MMRNNLKVYRASYNCTQEQLAEKMGVTRQTVIAIENNRYLPSLKLAFKLAQFFNVTIEQLFTYQQKED